jgi:phage terminase large subunit GpA-like protein
MATSPNTTLTTKTEALALEEKRERAATLRRSLRLFDRLSKLLRPPPKLTLSEWSDLFRRLSREASAEPGPWLTAKAPYQRAPMDAISDINTREVVLKWCSQAGKTEIGILNPLGFLIDRDPCPILVVEPTIETAEGFATERFGPMVRDTPCLRAKLPEPRTRMSLNRARKKMFPGGFVVVAGANSPASLAGRPIRCVLFNEVDRYPASAGVEGDPVSIARKRTTTFWNRKTILNSSPTIQGMSRIAAAFEDSTQEYWHLECPECAHPQVLRWERLRFEDAKLRCENCERFFSRIEWQAQRGEWVANAQNPTVRGFQLNALASPWIEWEELILEFRSAQRQAAAGDYEQLKVFINTRLAEEWEERGERIEHDLYRNRREVYHAQVPDGVLVLTAGADVQENRILYEIVGWGRGKESWGIEYGWVVGDTAQEEVWRALDEAVLKRVFRFGDGAGIQVRRCCIDSGFRTDHVYAFTKGRQPRAFSIKGEGGLGKPFIKGFGTSRGNHAVIVTLGVDTGKTELTSRFNVEHVGPGYCHFPKLDNDEPARGYDETYFEGLVSEKRVARFQHGFKTYIWVKKSSAQNEPFDVRNYALGAVYLPHTGINLETMSRDVTADKPDKPSQQAQQQWGVIPQSTQQQPPTSSGARPPTGSPWGTINRPVW